jgi:hypothetical protein
MQLFRAIPFAALPLLAGLMAGCGHPEGLLVGDTTVPTADLEEAAAELRASFEVEGQATLRWHLLEFGLAEAVLLHEALPEESAAARQTAERQAEALRASDDPAALFRAWLREQGEPDDMVTFTQPNPASMGAREAAAVAVLDDGQWTGPLRTATGWELLYLVERVPGPRNRANVGTYRMTFPVGTPEDRARAREAWDTLPLAGDPGILDVLPLDFRAGRVQETP